MPNPFEPTPMNKYNVLLLETIADEAHKLLATACNILMAPDPSSGTPIAQKHTIDAIVTRGKGKVDKSLIQACRPLKVIARCGVGLDNIDTGFASSTGIPVLNVPGSNADTVAEHTLGLILNLQRKITEASSHVREGKWSYRNQYDGDEVRGKTIGILGFGNIGQKVAKLAVAFGMKVIYWDVQEIPASYQQVTFSTLLMKSDIITIHLPLTGATRGLIDRNTIAMMAKCPIIINTARGPIVSDKDLLDALREGKVKGFGADVLEIGTPPQGYELLQLPNVMVTPHTASLTKTTYDEMCLFSVQNTLKVLHGLTIDSKYISNKSDLPGLDTLT